MGGTAKCLQSFQNKATYHPMNPESFLMLHITFDEISTTLSIYNSGKNRYTQYMWNNGMFILWNRISSIFYEDREFCLEILPNNMLLFINGLTFDIMNIQNNQSLEFESKPVLAPLRSDSDQRFSWLRNVFLKFFKD